MAKYGAKEVMDITFYDTVTLKPVLYLDTLKITNLENNADEAVARGGKGNPELLSWDFNRTSTVAVQDALMSMKSFGLMSGVDPVVKTEYIHKREVHVVATGTVTIAETPVVDSSHIMAVYKLEDGEEGVELTVDPTTPVVDSKYTISGNVLSFDAGNNGDSMIVYYQYEHASATVLEIRSDAFPGYYKMIGDTVIRNASNGQDESFQVVINKCKIQPTNTITFQAEGDPSVFDMNLKVFKEDDSSKMITMIKY